MARSKSSLTIYTEYWGVLALKKLLEMLPLSWAQSLASHVLHLFLLVVPKRRFLTQSNIAQAFPDLAPAEQRKIAKDSIDNLARGLSIFVHMPSLLAKPSLPWLHYLGSEHLTRALALGRGVIAFNAHFGCWEISSAYVMRHHDKVAAVYRPLDNPKINGMVTQLRCSTGGLMMDRKKVIREGIPFLRQNGILGIVVDQNFAGGGVFVDFFRRPAATTPIVSILARRTGSVVLPMHSWWEGNDLYLQWDPPFELSRNAQTEEAIAEDTQRMTTVVEGWIRKRPGQWLWLHNRWKRQPT